MKYHAQLIDTATNTERPVGIYGNDLPEIERWAQAVLATAHREAVVYVYQTHETPLKVIQKPEDV